jgi:hypothetical protein
MSESEAAGRLTRMPGIVEAERTRPVQASGVPRLFEKVLRTEPLLDIVELRIISPPIRQRLQNTDFPAFFVPEFIGEPARFLTYSSWRLIKLGADLKSICIC